ncbi:MAG: polyphosphate kinase 2 family protein [Gammaproteobacteria bacterium]|nr:polyphosphate kinase 2 family protein [Gammaproteobacteria bacterium]NNC66798.1 polyphosphate kinase 2 family protein [Gammaproteobacteria bacterium]
MFEAIESKFLVPYDGNFSLDNISARPPSSFDPKTDYRKKINKVIEELQDLQKILYAYDRHSMLLIFQAMDAAGKDSTIRAVMSGVNPAGCQVFSFKKPSSIELDHDFLWRTNKSLPERGRIGIFNRSYYEEVLVVRVHPKILEYQNLPDKVNPECIWQERYESIQDLEKHLARNGTVILKFWLNVSKEEQKNRFIGRIDTQEKQWKWSSSDLKEREHWDDYMQAYEDALNATSKPWAPWYAIPADDKPYMRYSVAKIVEKTLESLDLKYPKIDDAERKSLSQARKQLLAE